MRIWPAVLVVTLFSSSMLVAQERDWEQSYRKLKERYTRVVDRAAAEITKLRKRIEDLEKKTREGNAMEKNTEPASEVGAWSELVGGVRGRLHIGPGPELGTRTPHPTVTLELRNDSDVANPILVPASWTIRYQLYDAAGKAVPEATPPSSIRTPPPFGLVLPYDGSLTFRVSVTGFGVHEGKRALVGVPFRCWILEADDEADYFLGGTLSATRGPDDDRRAWLGPLKLPRCKIPAAKK